MRLILVRRTPVFAFKFDCCDLNEANGGPPPEGREIRCCDYLALISPSCLRSDTERSTLAEIAKRLGRKHLAEVGCVAKPDTILAWYRRLIVSKCDGSKPRAYAGRPRVDAAIEALVVRMARENSS